MTRKTAKKKTSKKRTRTTASRPKPPMPPADAGPASKKPTGPNTPATRKDAPPQADDSQEMVVFAFRLTRAERDLIHRAAGSAKASRFVRGLALAAAQGDLKAVRDTIEGLQPTSS